MYLRLIPDEDQAAHDRLYRRDPDGLRVKTPLQTIRRLFSVLQTSVAEILDRKGEIVVQRRMRGTISSVQIKRVKRVRLFSPFHFILSQQAVAGRRVFWVRPMRRDRWRTLSFYRRRSGPMVRHFSYFPLYRRTNAFFVPPTKHISKYLPAFRFQSCAISKRRPFSFARKKFCEKSSLGTDHGKIKRKSAFVINGHRISGSKIGYFVTWRVSSWCLNDKTIFKSDHFRDIIHLSGVCTGGGGFQDKSPQNQKNIKMGSMKFNIFYYHTKIGV